MKRKVRRKLRFGHAEPIVLLPPNLQVLGELPFTTQGFGRLEAWLAETGWPAGRMDIAMLEGYLVALLVWPIDLSPGAWLPPIWGVRGWKIAAKIASPETYAKFLALVIGFLQELERRLNASPRRLTFVLAHDAPYVSGRNFAGSTWGNRIYDGAAAEFGRDSGATTDTIDPVTFAKDSGYVECRLAVSR